MRFGRDARERIQWLIDFLRSFYDIQEICGESERLEARFRELISRGLKNEAQETLEYRRYLAEAMSEPAARSRHLDSILRGFLELRDVKKIKEIVADRALVSVSWETVKVAHRMGCLEELLAWADQMVSNQPGDWPILVNRSILLNLLKRHAEALAQLDEVLETHPAAAAAWILRGMTLRDLGRPEEAVRSVDTGLEHEPDDANAWLMRGELLLHLKRLAEAIVSADRALGIEARSARAFELRGNALLGLGRSGEALDSLDAALKCGAESIVSVQALRFLAGFALGRLDIAQQAWRDMVKALPKKEALSSFLLIFADVADPSFLRQLIREADLDEPLFPLARALEYVLTGDEALIEKLSPEVRGIVEQLVAKLRASGKPLPAKLPAQPRKRRKISRRASRHL